MRYVHVQIETSQSSKRPGAPCGDVVAFERTAAATTLILADGLGSGIKASVAANLCTARLMGLLRGGLSLRTAFGALARTMNDARLTDLPYSAFAVARILNDGAATVLSYEMDPPILAWPGHSVVLPHRTLTLDRAILNEAHCRLEPGEALLIVSDGITQAGMGAGLAVGWTIKGVNGFVNDCLGQRLPPRDLPEQVHRRARALCKSQAGDDCTAVLASCRFGTALNILTGPPADPKRDADTVRRFMESEGPKVVCGGTTAGLVSRALGVRVTMKKDLASVIAPPAFAMAGIDLVTEGAITLNQAYNVLDESPARFEEDSGVSRLCVMMHSADRVNIFLGCAMNPAGEDIAFRQRGIISRARIVPLIAERLRAAGKLVVVEES